VRVPELPEVETIRHRLAPLVEGRTLRALEILDAKWCTPLAPAALSEALEGRLVERLSRRGKYLVWEAEDEVYLLMHLRMTGTVLYDAPPGSPYVRVRLELDDGHDLSFCDPRRFGTGELALGRPALEDFFAARLGIEPLSHDFTAEHLFGLTRDRRAPIKALLLDQRRVAGVGNIYANEALFRAGIHPLRTAGALTRRQAAELRDAVVASLRAGIDAGGASIDDFRHPDGVKGAFQNEFLVHGRAGEACDVCGGLVVKFVAAGRGTYACERCQKRPRRRRR
jgi:formamidopyrimidine-DNA glycosylase